MLNKNAKLNSNVFDTDKLEQAPTRDGFGHGLVEAAEKDEKIVALCADLAESTRMHWFQEKWPERYVELGVAEQNLATVASGMANYGKIPFITSYAAFSPGRNNEQIRTTISLNNVPVKVVGSHAGISVGPDGATHQALEDIALMRVQPNMTVLSPCDSEEARKATIAAAKYDGPVYIRLARAKSPVFTTADTPFEFGKPQVFFESKNPQCVIISTGSLTYKALLVANELAGKGIEVDVINLATIKPLDEKILDYIEKAGSVVTVEEHQIHGGMGGAVAELIAKNNPVPIEFIGVHDRYGQSGNPDELYTEYQMDTPNIVKAVEKVIKRKN